MGIHFFRTRSILEIIFPRAVTLGAKWDDKRKRNIPLYAYTTILIFNSRGDFDIDSREVILINNSQCVYTIGCCAPRLSSEKCETTREIPHMERTRESWFDEYLPRVARDIPFLLFYFSSTFNIEEHASRNDFRAFAVVWQRNESLDRRRSRCVTFSRWCDRRD